MLEKDYQELHKIPELGFHEEKTSAYLWNRLHGKKANIFRNRTAICAFFNFHKPYTIAFRAEEDALPIQEKTKLSYTSLHKRKMHACGHDAHMSILLSLADFVNNFQDYPYNILFVFQPSEERYGGALSLLPFLNSFSFFAFFGMHVFPFLKEGEIYSSFYPLFSSANEIDILSKGISTHIANYKRHNDAIYQGFKVIKKMEKMAKEKDIFFHIGKVKGGKARNIVADQVIFQGTIRSDCEEKNLSFIESLQTFNKQCEIKVSPTIPALNVDKSLLEKLKNHNIHFLKKTFFQSEDFAFYPENYHPVFFLLGMGNTSPLHSDTFYVPLSIMEKGLHFYQTLLHFFK